MPNLAPVDWMVLLIYYFFTISIGVGLKAFTTSSDDFLLARRALPGWLCGLAFAGAGLGSLEILAMGAAGARYGLVSASFFGLGSVLPLLFAALFLVPVYYASKARSLPGYLRLRFDEKTRALGAALSLAGCLVSAALALYVMARVSAELRLFDVMFHIQRIGPQGVLMLSVALPTAIVLVYVLLGGLGATMYTQVMQLCALVAGFLPMVFLGLKQVGGWTGMKAAYGSSLAAHAMASPSVGAGVGGDFGAVCIAITLGVVLTAGAWCTDFTMLQTAFAAENARAARKAPLLAAAAKALLPFVLVLPGVIAVSLPASHTSETVRNENGTIYHEIDVVPQAVEQGLGLVPARTDSVADPMGGKVLHDAKGHALIDYSMAVPNLLPHNLPTGLLGLGLAALFACVTGGVAARIAAFNSVFVYDVYQAYFRKNASDKNLLAVGRWATLGASIVASGLAIGALELHNMPDLLDLLALSFAVLFAPLLGTFVLGALWKRATGCGAFAGLIAGVVAALAHWGVTLPAGYSRGIAGGWIWPMHHPANMLAQNAGTALIAMVANVLVTIIVSFATAPEPKPGLEVPAVPAAEASMPERSARRVRSAKPAIKTAWWKRPAGVAVLILLLAIVVTVIFG